MRSVLAQVIMFGCVLALPQYQMHMIADIWCTDDKLVVLQLSDHMEQATDVNCMEAADLFHNICKQGYKLLVKPYKVGGWVPSRINPMDVEWTKILVGESDPILKPKHSAKPAQRFGHNLTIDVIPDDRKVRPKPQKKGGGQRDPVEVILVK